MWGKLIEYEFTLIKIQVFPSQITGKENCNESGVITKEVFPMVSFTMQNSNENVIKYFFYKNFISGL